VEVNSSDRNRWAGISDKMQWTRMGSGGEGIKQYGELGSDKQG